LDGGIVVVITHLSQLFTTITILDIILDVILYIIFLIF